ncbi:hypothetical protein [Dyella sp. 2RAB6]|uniref:hypothetical protein n=2 Tax=Dyella sp. 2RAB6 TaxID=3232992 RepID=UPI003F916F7B
MNDFGDPWITRHAHYFSDPDAGPDALLNDATEWLQYAYNAIQLLAELVDERENIDAQRLPIMLEGISAFIDMGARCATQAHERMQWQQIQDETAQPPA